MCDNTVPSNYADLISKLPKSVSSMDSGASKICNKWDSRLVILLLQLENAVEHNLLLVATKEDSVTQSMEPDSSRMQYALPSERVPMLEMH